MTAEEADDYRCLGESWRIDDRTTITISGLARRILVFEAPDLLGLSDEKQQVTVEYINDASIRLSSKSWQIPVRLTRAK